MRHRHIFSAVFPTSAYTSTQPTPLATPETQFVSVGQSFGGGQDGRPSEHYKASSDPVTQQIYWDRAWHSATSLLSLPKEHISFHEPSQIGGLHERWNKARLSPASSGAIRHVLRPRNDRTPHNEDIYDASLVDWYGNEVRRHFLAFVGPDLCGELENVKSEDALYRIIKTLQDAQSIYLFPLVNYIIPILETLYDPIADREKSKQIRLSAKSLGFRFKRDVNAIIINSLPRKQLYSLLRAVFGKEIGIILGLPANQDAVHSSQLTVTGEDQDMTDGDDGGVLVHDGQVTSPVLARTRSSVRQSSNEEDVGEKQIARGKVLKIFGALEHVGLGGERGQRVFAEVMNSIMTDYVTETFSDRWRAPSTVPDDLRTWVEDEFARLIVQVLHCVTAPNMSEVDRSPNKGANGPELVSLDEVEKWREMSIGRLGKLRVTQLFDLAVDWDASEGAIMDLIPYLTAPLTRSHLVTSLTHVLSQRLLHPGASTIDILRIYISLIRMFALLDPPGVLIDRIARPIRRYLRDREDTVRVIVTGLLASTEGDDDEIVEHGHGQGNVLVELAIELNQASELAAQGDDDDDLDWDDMRWMPDPVDAGPDYKKSKSSDVIGSLVSLFESKDVFIKEFQNVMGERLLKRDFDLDKEVRILELLKLRFGEGALQASEVMLRDIQESKAIDRNIRGDQGMVASDDAMRTESDSYVTPSTTDLHARILSRLFWPDLQDTSFAIPDEIIELQKRYEKGFENLKQSRKLTWLNALGQVSVELEFEDHTIVEEVHTWQASVIYAFQDLDDSSAGPLTRNVQDLSVELEMDESLVRTALRFWTNKRALHEVSKDVFGVLETLEQMEDGLAATILDGLQMEVETDAGGSSIKSADEQATAKLKIYWQFIVGMLTNGGPMPLPQIVTMLKFAVAGGFPFGEDELRDFLSTMVHDNQLELVGGKYKINS